MSSNKFIHLKVFCFLIRHFVLASSKLWCMVCFLLPVICFGQTVQTFIDKKDILIGEQIQYKIKTSYPANAYQINWFSLPDTIPHFEILSISPIDSLKENDKTVLTQTIIYTSFDSGRWNIPSLTIQARALNEDSVIDLKTDSFAINILYAKADSTNQLRDIKPIIEVATANYFWYYLIGSILFLLLLGWVIWRYYKSKNKNLKKWEPALSAYDEAMQALGQLQSFNLSDKQQLKQFHIQLSLLFKIYCSRISGRNMLNNTTDDMLVQLSILKITKDNMTKAATALRCGDAVKFAKFLPSVGESEDCKNSITDVIKNINQYFTKT